MYPIHGLGVGAFGETSPAVRDLSGRCGRSSGGRGEMQGRSSGDLPRRAGSPPSESPPAQRLSATGVRPALAPRAPPSASIHGHLPATLWGCAVALSGARLRLARRPTVEGQTAQAEHTAFTGLPSVRHVTPTSLGRRSPSVGDPRWASRAAKLRAAWHRFT